MFAKVNGTHLYFDVEGAKLVPDGSSWRKKPTCFVVHGGPGGEHIGFKPFLTPLSESMQLNSVLSWYSYTFILRGGK
ncbi:hypothetical protein [Peribacillus butanolivorans]|uniref:hypothetical protein n=1 Tax=Peribacillus butanolivorans TaxID=421767 RepID=UPI0035E289D7